MSSLTQADVAAEVPKRTLKLCKASDAALRESLGTLVEVVSRSDAEEDRGGGDVTDAFFFRPSWPKNCMPPEIRLLKLRLSPKRGVCSLLPELDEDDLPLGGEDEDEGVFPDFLDSSDLRKADGRVR